MMISVYLAKDEHQMLVRKLIEHFESIGLIVTCACSGHVDCLKVKNYEPDVRAYDTASQLHYIGEAKTCDNLQSQHTKDQFLEFSDRVMIGGTSKGKDIPFYIIVPETCKPHLAQLLNELGLSNKENVNVV